MCVCVCVCVYIYIYVCVCVCVYYIHICICIYFGLSRVAAPSLRASLGRRMLCGRTEQRRPQASKRCETKVRMVWGSFLIAALALKTLTRNG